MGSHEWLTRKSCINSYSITRQSRGRILKIKKDIYIIKNSVNSKVYIGQAKNAAERWLSHIYNANYEYKHNKSTQVIHKAMMKYGIEKFHYEILEYQIENYDEREVYWINFYNSIVPNGYNVSIGGDGVGYGLNHPSAIFNNKQNLLKCISEISSSNKTFVNIAKKFNCSSEVISAINNGERYKMDNLNYPLRKTDTKYATSLIKQIRYSLKYELDLTLKDIATKYNVDCSQVSEINNGKIYYVYNEFYPLRNKRKTDLTESQVSDIINDILYSQLCLTDIAKKYDVSKTRISGINQGTFYVRTNLEYPLRKDNDFRSKSLKKFLEIDCIKDIHQLLETEMSISKIAKKYDVSKTTIYNINNGKCHKYVLNGYKYPIRKIKNF